MGEIFERNNIRDKINIATKLPQYLIGNRAALDRYFGEELSRLRTDHVDYYLMHHLTDVAMWEKLKNVGILDWIQEKKQSGAIRNIGFSYHGRRTMTGTSARFSTTISTRWPRRARQGCRRPRPRDWP